MKTFIPTAPELAMLSSQSSTITGLVVPSSWDAAGNVISVMISATDENEYRVQGDEMTRLLLPHLRKMVCMHGRISISKGQNVIHAFAFEILSNTSSE